MRTLVLSILVAVASGLGSAAQTALSPTDERRMNFYSEKLVTELKAIADATSTSDEASIEAHRVTLLTMTDRWVLAAAKVGLDDNGAEAFFRNYFARNYTGRIPIEFANDIGLISIASLRQGLLGQTDGGSVSTSYVSTIREAGSLNAGN